MSSVFKSLKVNAQNTRKLTDCCKFQDDKLTGNQVSKTHGYIAGMEYMCSGTNTQYNQGISTVYPQYTQDIPRILPREYQQHTPSIPMLYSKYTLSIVYSQYTYKVIPKYTQKIPKVNPGYTQSRPRVYPEYTIAKEYSQYTQSQRNRLTRNPKLQIQN